MTKTALLLLTTCAGAGLGAADTVGTDYRIRVHAGAWFLQPGGEVALNEDGSSDFDSVDLDELDLDDAVITPVLDAGLRLPLLFDIHAGLVAFGSDASSMVGDPFDFGDSTFSGAVTTDVDLLDLYGELNWRLLSFDLGGASVGLAVHLLQGEVTVSSGGVSETLDEAVVVPALAGRVYVNPLDQLGFEGRIHLMSLDVGDIDVTFYDINAQAVWRPWSDHLGLVAGLRTVRYDVHYDEGDIQGLVDLSMWGVHAGVVLQF